VEVMSFMPTERQARRVPGVGPRNAKIAIVGEAPGAYEDAQLKPFVGPAGGVLEQCLHSAGLIRSDVYLTNVVKVRPNKNDIAPFFNGKTFSAEGIEWVKELRIELDELKPNIVVACGKTAMAALTGQTAITKLRGYVLETIELEFTKKCIPCIHPAACLYGRGIVGDSGGLATSSAKPYLYRYIITCDLKKAKHLSADPALVRPNRQLVYNFANVHEVLEWLEYFAAQPLVAFDIEVLNFEVSCISFSSDSSIAASIPIAHTWSEFDEMQIWRGIQKVLGNEKSIKVGQNLVFDIHFLLTRCGVETRGPIQDTMMAHSIIYPELPKGLAFLGSIYCGSQEYWKDLVKFDDIKENS
jgi:uracil-DNA glycosylase